VVINVSVTRTDYGSVGVEVPEGSVILDPSATDLRKRRAARKLAEDYIKNGGEIRWHTNGVIYADLFYSEVPEGWEQDV